MIILKAIIQRYFELTFWIIALTLLAFMQPGNTSHYSFCFFKLAGINFCPGCGLGHSIGYLFHGNISASFASHPLGPFALIIILQRIYNLFRIKIINQHKNYVCHTKTATP